MSRISFALVCGAALALTPALAAVGDPDDVELRTVEVKAYGVSVQVPADWEPVAQGEDSLVFGFKIPSDDPMLLAAVKCEIGAAPQDLEALGEQMPAQLKREDPNCTVKSCQRVRQGAIGDALETVVETQRGPFRITVLERRYMGRRYNYEIKFTVDSETFETSAEALRKSADSFVEFIAPEDVKGGAT